MSRSCEKLKIKRLWVGIILVFNIIFGTSVILVVLFNRSSTSSLYKRQKEIDSVKQEIDEIYNTEKKKFDITQAPISVDTHDNKAKLEVLNLLKPVSQLSGLDFDDNKKNNHKRKHSSVIRNWANNKGAERYRLWNDKHKRKHSSVIRNWANNKGAERYLLWNGMKYENGSISVPVNGVYHVRSHVKFYVENNHANQSIEHFQHKLLRYIASTRKQELVVSNTVSECTEGINDGAHLEYPSDLGCLVHLNAGDQLSVKVSHWDLLTHDRDWHSFGAYLI